MSAVVYRLRSTFLRRWASVAVLIVTIAGVSGLVLSIAAGAHRTDTAVDRFTTARGGDVDAIVIQQDGGPPITDQVRALPAVESADSITFIFAALLRPGTDEAIDALPFVGTTHGFRGRLVSGRAANPAIAAEFVATESFAKVAGALVGDKFQLVSLTQKEVFQNGFDSPTHGGPSLTAELVGIIDAPTQIQDPAPTVIFSQALLGVEGDGGAMAVSQSNIAVELRGGFDLVDLRRQLDSLEGSASLGIGSGHLVDDDLRQAVNTQAVGLWLLALVAAAAAMVVLSQLILRSAQVTEAERERLIQIGATSRSVLAESIGRAVVPIVIGCTLGIAIAVIPSGGFPTGLARKYEPSGGVYFDPAILLTGALLLMIVLGVCAAVALQLGSRPRLTVVRPSSLERVAARSPSAVAATGLRFAFGRRPTGRSGARGAVLAITTSVALLVAALVFGVSMDRLIDQPARYGVNFQLAAGGDGSGTLSPALLDVVSTSPGVRSAILYSGNHARRADKDVDLLGMQELRGSIAPAVTTGKLPVSPEEIVLGRATARDLDVSLGDSIDLVGLTGAATFRVTGFAVIPGFGANEGVGRGALLTMDGLRHLDENAQSNVVAVDFEPGPVGVQAVADVKKAAGIDPNGPDERLFRPAVITNINRVREIPFVLALVVGVLSLLTVVNVVFSSVRHRRRELAILRSLGAGGGWIVRAVHWQSTLLSVVPAAIGAGIGIVIGRQVFTAFGGNIGAIDDPLVPTIGVGLIPLSLVVLANLAALAPGRSVRLLAPAAQLHVE